MFVYCLFFFTIVQQYFFPLKSKVLKFVCSVQMLHLQNDDNGGHVSKPHPIKAQGSLEVQEEDQPLLTKAHIPMTMPKIQLQVHTLWSYVHHD